MYTNQQLEAVSDFVTALQFVASRPNVRMGKNANFKVGGREVHRGLALDMMALGSKVEVCAMGANILIQNYHSPTQGVTSCVYRDFYGPGVSITQDNDAHGWEYVRDRLVAILRDANLKRLELEFWGSDLAGGVGLGN